MLTINEFAEFYGLNPYAFNQLESDGLLVGYDHHCGVWFEKSYYTVDSASMARDDVKQAIEQAIRAIRDAVGYFPKASFVENEEHIIESHYVAFENDFGYQAATNKLKTVSLDNQYLLSLGREEYTVIEAEAAVVTSDENSDTFHETFTVGPIAVSDINYSWQLGIYHTTANRNNEELSEDWRILPVQIVYDGNNITFKGKRYLLVKPELQNTINPQPLNIGNDANFVDKLAVVALAADTQYGTAYWETLGETSDITYTVRKQNQSVITPSHTNTCVSDLPDRYKLNYWSGVLPTFSGSMNANWKEIVCLLAASYLPNSLCCQCDAENNFLKNMQKDMAIVGKEQKRYATFFEQNAGWGTRQGSIEAYRRILNYV